MRIAAFRSAVCSTTLAFGLEITYPLAFGIAGTETCSDWSTRGRSRVVFQPTSASTGDGSESRYRPTHPYPVELVGLAVDQMSVPRKWERLWFGYPVRWIRARRPASKICF